MTLLEEIFTIRFFSASDMAGGAEARAQGGTAIKWSTDRGKSSSPHYVVTSARNDELIG